MAPAPRAVSAVPSREPSSTTMSSASGCSSRSLGNREERLWDSSLAGMTMESLRFVPLMQVRRTQDDPNITLGHSRVRGGFKSLDLGFVLGDLGVKVPQVVELA